MLAALMLQGAVALSQQLTVENDSGKQTVLARSDIEALPRVKVTTSASGTLTNYQGILLKSALERAGIAFGETLKGKRLASCLLVEAADGYRVVIALPEMDPAFGDKQVILAFLKDGMPLTKRKGHTASS